MKLNFKTNFLLLIIVLFSCYLSVTSMLRAKNSLKSTTNLLNDDEAFNKLSRSFSRKNRLNLLNGKEDELKEKVGFILDGKEYYVVDKSKAHITKKEEIETKDGGFGSVYIVKDKKDELYAVKTLFNSVDSRSLKNSKALAELLVKNKPSYIMKILKFFSYDNNKQAAFLLPFIDGDTLDNIIRKNYNSKFKKLDVNQIKCIISSLIFGGFELFKLGIIHGDLFARNIMIKNIEGSCPESVIIDVDDKYTLETITDHIKNNIKKNKDDRINYLFLPQDTLCHRISFGYMYQPIAMTMNLIQCELLFVICSYVKQKNCFDHNQMINSKSLENLLKSIEDEAGSDESLRNLAKSIGKNLNPAEHYSYKDGIKELNTALDGLLEKMNDTLFNEIVKYDEKKSKKQLQKFLDYYAKHFKDLSLYSDYPTKDVQIEVNKEDEEKSTAKVININ